MRMMMRSTRGEPYGIGAGGLAEVVEVQVPSGGYFDLDDLRETARTDSVYGFSRVERIIMRINQGLRKQNFDMSRFTDGSTPLGIIAPPAALNWTPEQLHT